MSLMIAIAMGFNQIAMGFSQIAMGFSPWQWKSIPLGL